MRMQETNGAFDKQFRGITFMYNKYNVTLLKAHAETFYLKSKIVYFIDLGFVCDE